MRTLVHLSDLHFGRVDPATLRPVRTWVQKAQPDITIVSGDFTQRARAEQFREARDFVETLPGRKLAVPGNHDVPLYNVFARFLAPLRNYRRYISTDIEPFYADDEIAVLGINTARSLTWKHGRINARQVARMQEKLCNVSRDVIKIIITHHPFDLAESYKDDELVGRARIAMEQAAKCGADVLLAGHFHLSYTGGTAKRYKIHGHSALVIQAGTATSSRRRGEANSFNILRVNPPQIAVQILSWNPDAQDFFISETKNYRRGEAGWERVS